MNTDNLKKLVRMIASTQEDEIGCADCFAEIDQFVDQMLRGKAAHEAMPLVEHHLKMCHDCHEEFQALLTALKSP